MIIVILRRWLRRKNIYTGRITRVKYYDEYSDLPTIPKANELAIAGTPENPKWALLDCPCGNGHTVCLSLGESERFKWSVSQDEHGCPSIYPSIDRNKDHGVRCHYWVENGFVKWV